MGDNGGTSQSYADRITTLEVQFRAVVQELDELKTLARRLAGNGHKGSIDRLQESVHGLQMTVAEKLTKVESSAQAAHRRLDWMTRFQMAIGLLILAQGIGLIVALIRAGVRL